ncbi:MAG: MFS transporter [Rhodobacteraceae bacterium]|uniref:MFS transporter n=1 Tax=Albidovulum sp. TaxID=1872424 RepID=UPI001DF1EA85|nr:MFS transporter [Paracoccaceae bacterium]MCC0045469.1 MFS transporter [Defluviimonas sp.]HRV63653.1 MFS transporter [Albidovulum sp.]MCB2122332.1 MFS transporter [Paracoccaceae bacterium]MCB2132470.1 MFS transporter [Paracoccaceae bacterium]
MRLDIFVLILGYVLSQFYRAFLAVLAPVLGRELGVTASDLALSSGLWFFSFAVMQIPVGIALDRIGPRATASVLLALGGAGGAMVFALAEGPVAIHVAMVMIGVGCSPVLMASYFIFARLYSPAVFGTLAGMMIGFGSLGNIAGSAPLALLVDAVGWRAALFGLAATTMVVAAALAIVVRDPERIRAQDGGRGSVADLLRLPGFWAILPLMAVAYAPAASIRGLWAGPMLSDLYGADSTRIGTATLAMGLAMVAGNFAYGPLDRLFGTRKWVVFWGNALAAVALAVLAIAPDSGFWTVTALLAALGLMGSSFPAIMAHGRAFFPPHLIGRGVTFLNMFGIGGAGILQFASGGVFGAAAQGTPDAGAYTVLLVFFLVPLLIGLGIYLLSRESPE